MERGPRMSTSPAPYFFISYSREDTAKQKRVIRELRERGIHLWVDIENLTPGTPTWEREIEKAIRGATGIVVLLSPESNNSEWVRREISFGEQHRKRIFPVLIEGDDHTSTPLRLSNHQRVDLRTKFETGLDELAQALKEYISVKQEIASQSQVNLKRPSVPRQPASLDWKKIGIPALIAMVGLLCLAGGIFAIRAIGAIVASTDTPTQPPVIDPVIVVTDPVIVDPDQPAGRIVFTCNVKGDEVCMVNADGSGWRQLTDSLFGNFNASLAPDGRSMVYVASDGTTSEVYEMDLASGRTKQLTALGVALGAPEISPDGTSIVFHYRDGNNAVQLWIMQRDGSNPRELYSNPGNDVHDGTWSPDGSQILFAMGRDENNKLYIMDADGGAPRVVNDSIDTRGRSDWSANNLISFDQGGPFAHNVYLMGIDGSGLRQVSQADSNAQGASLSPDGQWIAFTGYTDVPGKDENSCEIFIMRIDGSDMRQLTDNKYCDYQPRWGN